MMGREMSEEMGGITILGMERREDMPKSDGTHYVDAILTYEGDEVATVTGTYKSECAGDLDAEFERY